MWYTVRLFVLAIFGLSYLLEGCSGSFEDSILLFTDSFSKGLFGVSSKTGAKYTVGVQRVLNPIAIQYNEINERIYWSDVSLKEIRSTSIDGQDDVILRDLNTSSTPDGLAIDSVTELLFYTDAGNHLIALMTLDGLNHAVVVSKDCDQPRAIVVDPMSGLMYWTDWGTIPKIESAYYDGSNRKELVTTKLLWPNAMAIDFRGEWMYWADAGTHYIERSKLDGSNRKILYFEEIAHFFSITFLSDSLYYTDWKYKTIMALNISRVEENSTSVGTATSEFAVRLNGIARLKAKPMYPRTNACSKNKGGCSHICLPRPKGKHVCLCPTGLSLVGETRCETVELRTTCAALNPNKFMTILPIACITQNSSIGAVCSVQCIDGFFYGGIYKDVVCTEGGMWSANIQDCIDASSPVIHNCPDDAQVLEASKGQNKLVVHWPNVYATDNSGIEPEIYETMKSGVTLQEGEYTVNIFAVDHVGHFSVCEFTVMVKVRRCGVVPVPDRGYIVSGWCPDYYGAKCKIGCNTGYQLNIDRSVANIEFNVDKNNVAEWTGDILRCEPIVCPAISLPNVLVTGCTTPFGIGTVCEQTCVEGFEKLHGTGVRACKPDGSWSGQDLMCKEKSVQCHQLLPLSNSHVVGCSHPYIVGSLCEQVCNLGYQKESQGSGIRVCKPDGAWSGYDVACFKTETLTSTGTVSQTHEENLSVSGFGTNSLFLAALVVVVTLMLINLGIFIHLQKLGSIVQSKSSKENNELHANGTSEPVTS